MTSIHYAKLSNEFITPKTKDDAIKTKGYFIYLSQLFANVVAKINQLRKDIDAIVAEIEGD